MSKASQLNVWEQSLRRAKERLSANEEQIDSVRSARIPGWKRDAEIHRLKAIGETIQEDIDEATRQIARIKAIREVHQLSLFGGVA